ncbi:hypothetical protein HAX54_022526 [Datura stramonium]|uniref:BRCT domain-containing protein n=1 Tax=Datura stramonium TaxID=4076 RepID=A0ABS8UV99_DATST|nr:hypothetical protein [Datura stramonium]
MTEGNQDMLYDGHSKIFVGVRFVLVGFDPIRKGQIRSMILEGGGVDGNRYGPDCTHLIVDSIIYDDPVCVAARRDGKIVVTSLWVVHSFDVGMPVDHHSVMYRPPRDLNGIRGAKSLIVCLTGYQRQDRDDIMLVNHRWLEDCLRSWEILLEAEYDKSGYELEMMEAEAKDSEEENEGIAANGSGETIAVMGPEHPKSPNQFLVKQEASTNVPDLTFRVSNSAGKSPHSRSSREIPRKFSSPMTSEQMKSYAGSPATIEAEDQEDEELNVRREKSTDTEAQHSGLRSMEKKLNVNKVVSTNDEGCKRSSTENNKSETQKTISGKETKINESTSAGKASVDKVSKSPKYLKNSKKTNLATKRAAVSVEGAERKKCRTDRNKVEAKKGNESPSETDKAKVVSTEHQLKSSMNVEKENIPVIGAARTQS